MRLPRLPSGVSPAREEFQRKMNEIVAGLDGVRAVHDYVLTFGCGDNNAKA